MKILLLGGTRFIGPAIVRRLAERGHEVAVFHRGKSAAEPPAGVRSYIGDRTRLADSIGDLHGFNPDVVVDMIPFTADDAQQVAQAFRGHARRLVAISSCDVYRAYGVLLGKEPGPSQATPIAEDADLRPQLYPFRGDTPRAADDPRRFLDDYDKILVEREVLAHPDLPGTVLRLPMVYGPGDGQRRMFPYLKRIADGRDVILLAAQDAKRRFSRGFVENVAEACAVAIESDTAAGQVYNVADEPALTEIGWIEAIARQTQWAGRIEVLPDAAVPPSLRHEVDTDQDLLVSSEKIRALGFSEPVALEEAVARTVEWELANFPAQIDPAQFDYAAEDAALAAR